MDPYSSSRNSVQSNHNSDERSSRSPSDDGNNGYPMYNDVNKAGDNDSEDANSSLTSQTLNADGTPKRPMNAFMIFARRRRPQVSSENTSMRTGEISKILSREWNAMPPSEKQFYLDQAKQLKDKFNDKYPDYVYRRRPNHSRKRRRTEHSVSHNSVQGHNGALEHSDGLHGNDVGESPPSEGGHGVHGHVDGPNSGSYLRMQPPNPHDPSMKYGGSNGHGLQSRMPYTSSGQTVPPFSDITSFRGSDRIPFLPPNGDVHRPNTLPPPRSMDPQSQGHLYGHNGWESGRERSSWSSDRSTTRTSFSSSSSATPPLPGHSWSPPPTASSTAQGAASTTSNEYPSFSTLNSPFYPSSGAHPPSSAQSFTSSPPSSSNHLPPPESASSERHGSYQPHHRNSYPSSSPRDSHSSYQRGDMPRALPAISSFGGGSDPLGDFGSWRPPSTGHGIGH